MKIKMSYDNVYYTYDIYKSNKIIQNTTEKLKIEIYVLFIKRIHRLAIMTLFSVFNIFT